KTLSGWWSVTTWTLVRPEGCVFPYAPSALLACAGCCPDHLSVAAPCATSYHKRCAHLGPGALMKITRIAAYAVDLPLHGVIYKGPAGKGLPASAGTVVEVSPDAGITGYGEVCPLGPFYLPAYAKGVRIGLAELGPHLLGEDPTQLEKLNRRMDAALQGHPYVKSALDMACWDILGHVSGQPVCVLLGGHYGDDFRLYRAISQTAPAAL